MKWPIIFVLLLTGCCRDIVQVSPDNLKFHAGQEVTTTISFYKGCDGNIAGYFPYKDAGDETDYSVDFGCRGAGRLENIRIKESKLIAKEDQ